MSEEPSEKVADVEVSSAEPEEPTLPFGDAPTEDAANAPKGDGPEPARRPRDPALARAFRTHRPVQGRILGVIKGGYEVRVGKARAFCPHSQIDLVRVEDPESFVGRTLYFLISQFRRGGEDIVISRRALLEAERADEAKAVRATLIEGSVMQGRVSGTAEFGAFVDLGAGVQGLVHVSEISHARVTRVDQAVKVGEVVRVKILKIDDGGGRISLSIREAQPDPWPSVAQRFEPGRRYPGRVLRVAPFGVFVELAPGLEALAPAREFPPGDGTWDRDVQPGAEREWLVLAVDGPRHRIAVIPALAGSDGWMVEPVRDQERVGLVQHIERFGVFVWLGPGRVGLMPTPLAAVPQGVRLEAKYRPGTPVEVRVLDVTDGGHKIRLAAKDAPAEALAADADRGAAPPPPRPRERPVERRPAAEPARSASKESAPAFGNSMADALRAALDRGGKR